MDYVLMKEISKKAAKWWADKLREKLPANMCIDAFQKYLEMDIQNQLSYIGFVYLTVGEYPESLLASAAEKSGIDFRYLPKASTLVTTRSFEEVK